MAEGLRTIGNEAGRNILSSQAYKLWFDQRRDTLLSRVSAHDVLRHFGVALKFGGSDRSFNFLCPFHGDHNDSATVHPDEGVSRSGVHCYVCGGRWDIFSLWEKFNSDTEMKWSSVLSGLERAFNIETPEPPAGLSDQWFDIIDPEEVEQWGVCEELLGVCEIRLKFAKPNFELDGFLIVGQLLDRLHYRVSKRDTELGAERAQALIHQVLTKIGEKIRAEAAQDQNP